MPESIHEAALRRAMQSHLGGATFDDVLHDFAQLSDSIIRHNAGVRAFAEATGTEIERMWEEIGELRDSMLADFATRDDLSDLRALIAEATATPFGGKDSA